MSSSATGDTNGLGKQVKQQGTEVPSNKNPPKITLSKKVCKIDWSNLCLQQFGKYAAHAITGNGNYANLLELIYKKS